jgi:hypothetical protein
MQKASLHDRDGLVYPRVGTAVCLLRLVDHLSCRLAVSRSLYRLINVCILYVVILFLLYFSGKKCPPFKIVILDEADSMTRNAQVRASGVFNLLLDEK